MSGLTILLVSLCLFTSCTKTVFKGEYRSLLTSADQKKIVFVDFTGIEHGVADERLRRIPGPDLPLVHLYCINPVITEISEQCIAECGKQFQSDLVVVCRTQSLDGGDLYEHRSDYIVRTQDSGVIRPSENTTHLGSVFFDVYDTRSGGRVSEFEVSVRISGVGIKDKKGLGYTHVNLAQAEASIVKAKRKGLKNILKRLISRPRE